MVTTETNVSQAVGTWLDSLDLDGAKLPEAAIARTLAARLDAIGDSDTGSLMAAAASIAKELRSTLRSITADSDGAADFTADLFADD
ncbi:MAG TPA: hypothetical protein VNG12_12460 [Acidimicrobiales bacterium]|nr:hypothetical protein [Acidimicrobiales bacterium]